MTITALVFTTIPNLQTILEKEGIEFKVFMIPVYFEDQSNFDNYPLHNMHVEIMDKLVESDIDAKDLLMEYSLQNNRAENYYLDRWHPSPEGHSFIAKQLVDWLK